MPLGVNLRTEHQLAILDLTGPLTLGPSLHSLQVEARRVLENGKAAALVLDVSHVDVVDSAGLGELTVIYSLATRRGCQVVLVGVTPQLRHILEVTRLDALLPSSDSLAAAKKLLKIPGV